MRYLAMIYGNEATGATMTQQEREAEMIAYNAFTADVIANDVLVAGEALLPTQTATTVRVRDGKIVTTDGPFAETKEQLGGYYVLSCKDLDEVIAIAAKIPGALSGSIEVRPIMEFPAN